VQQADLDIEFLSAGFCSAPSSEAGGQKGDACIMQENHFISCCQKQKSGNKEGHREDTHEQEQDVLT
jgi:hypothetical protein